MKRQALLSLILVAIFGLGSFATAKDKIGNSNHKVKTVAHQKLDYKVKNVGFHKCHKHCKRCHCKKGCHCKHCHCKHGHCKCCHHKSCKSLMKPADMPMKPINPGIGNEKPVAEKLIVETKSVVAETTVTPAKPIASTDAPADAKPIGK